MGTLNLDNVGKMRDRQVARQADPASKDEYRDTVVASAADGEAFIKQLAEMTAGRFVPNAGAIEKSLDNADANPITTLAIKTAKGSKPSRTATLYDTVETVKVSTKNWSAEELQAALDAAELAGEVI